MSNFLSLGWKDFSVNLNKARALLSALIGADFDGLVAREDRLDIYFLNGPTQEQIDAVNAWWDAAQASDFAPSQQEIVSTAISQASSFGNRLALDFVTENVLLGITQAGKSGALIDYLHELVHCILSGSLYQAITVIDGYIADTSQAKANLQPFVTNERLTVYKNRVQDYLGIPRT